MRHRTWIDIDDRALAHNVQALKGLLVEGSRFSAVVKANAYGHGLSLVVPVLRHAGVDAFCVDSVEEGLLVRELAPHALILVLGMVPEDRVDDAIRHHLELTVYSLAVLRMMSAAAHACGEPVRVHLKADTGMHRQGLMPAEWADALAFIRSDSHLVLSGVSTHFANVDDPSDSAFSIEQFSRFQEAVTAVREIGLDPVHIHAANSAATILYPETHGTLVRCGAAMYGFWPSEDVEQDIRKHAIRLELHPVLSWKTRVSQVKMVPAGSWIGYGRTEQLGKSTRLAILPIGYADGYDRGFSSVGDIVVHGTKCRVVGRVSMNMTIIDVSALPQVKAGDEAVIIGRTGRHGMSLTDAAHRIHTIPYEFVSRLPAHIPRELLSGS